MNADWTDSFKLFLSWLSEDQSLAAEEYEKLRRKLIIIFNNRGCAVSEDLADETFNRVTRRLPAIIESYQGQPAPYIYKTAHRVYLDYLEKVWAPLPENLTERAQPERDPEEEKRYQCLDQCIKGLNPKTSEMVLSYYRENHQAKIDHRKEMAESLKLDLNAMRIRLYRVRKSLRQCIEDCMQRGEPVR
ncbi:MAG TPA: hypothetical protein VJ302_14750 [Blastocatellia bacterium]|nr:hypothetical protein [Blastocatellia bacterium]